MGDFFKGLLDKAPAIIHEAAQSPLGLASLIVLVLGVLAFFWFRNASGKLKLLVFGMITVGFLGLVLVFVPASNRANLEPTPGQPPPGKSSPEQTALPPQPGKSSPDKTALGDQAFTKFSEAFVLRDEGQYDQARVAFGEALTLYKQADDRPRQALTLSMLGELESKLGHYEQARDSHRDAMNIYQEIGDPGGQAKALFWLGLLDSRKNPKQAARYFVESARLYETIGMTESHDAALLQADKLSKR